MTQAQAAFDKIHGRGVDYINPMDIIHTVADSVVMVKTRTGIWDIIFPDRSEIQFANFGAIWNVTGVYAKPVDVQ